MSNLLTSPSPTGTCVDCEAELEHCHETLVLHDDGSAECPDSECAAHWETHEFRLFCDERSGSCLQCRPAPPADPAPRLFTRRRLATAA